MISGPRGPGGPLGQEGTISIPHPELRVKSLDLLTLFLCDPHLPVHGTDELENQFVEQGTLGVVPSIEERKDDLFVGLVVLFHLTGQVESYEEMDPPVLPEEEAGSAEISDHHRQEILIRYLQVSVPGQESLNDMILKHLLKITWCSGSTKNTCCFFNFVLSPLSDFTIQLSWASSSASAPNATDHFLL